MIDPAFLDQLKELDFVIKKRISSTYSGGRASIKHGRGIEVVDYREYMPGDDFRLIDWRVYARTEKLYIRRFEEEQDLIMHILVDSSASMDYTSHTMTKYDYAGSIAAGLGYLSTNNQEKFALALYSNTLRELTQPKKSQMHLFNVIELMNQTPRQGATNLGVCASQYSKLMKSKALTVVVSDFMEEIDSFKEGVYRLAKHSAEMVLIQVLDPWELDMGYSGDIKFKDLESSEVRRSYMSPGFKKEYVERVREHIAQLTQACEDLGVYFHTVLTDKPLFDSFVKIVGGGKRGG
ncbi:MAG: DUF58 domain-containing protein [Candidatus Altiarchaeota archaeon]|nr:DUF58 domain-containing protein [Candidatus Altiarchaeota archaeon]